VKLFCFIEGCLLPSQKTSSTPHPLKVIVALRSSHQRNISKSFLAPALTSFSKRSFFFYSFLLVFRPSSPASGPTLGSTERGPQSFFLSLLFHSSGECSWEPVFRYPDFPSVKGRWLVKVLPHLSCRRLVLSTPPNSPAFLILPFFS